jgi:hypothetical protein
VKTVKLRVTRVVKTVHRAADLMILVWDIVRCRCGGVIVRRTAGPGAARKWCSTRCRRSRRWGRRS